MTLQGKVKLAGHLIAGWAVLSWVLSYLALGLFWEDLGVGSGHPLILPPAGDILVFGPPLLGIVGGLTILVLGVIKRTLWPILEGILALLSGLALVSMIILALALGSVS